MGDGHGVLLELLERSPTVLTPSQQPPDSPGQGLGSEGLLRLVQQSEWFRLGSSSFYRWRQVEDVKCSPNMAQQNSGKSH
jgi:hypothetical protein